MGKSEVAAQLQQTSSVATAAFIEKNASSFFFYQETQKESRMGMKGEKGWGEIKQNFLDTDGAQVSATFSSFISCYSLCITLGFQSDAVHRLENYPKTSLQQWCGTSESVEQQLGKRCETKEGVEKKTAKNGSASNKQRQWFWEKVD